MSDDLSAIASVGEPAPRLRQIANVLAICDWLAGLGAGLRGTIAPATVVIREEFRPEEWSAFEAGRYVVGVKIYHRSGVVGLVLELVAPGSTMRRHMNKGSLAAVAAELEPFFAEDAKRRYEATVGRPKKSVEKVPQISSPQPKAREEAAKSVGVNDRYVQDAKKVKHLAIANSSRVLLQTAKLSTFTFLIGSVAVG